MDRLVRYLPDTTGENPSNLVRDERHTLEDRRLKCIALYHGSFYVDSVIIKQVNTDYELVHNKDYVYADVDYKLSQASGRVVANVLIVINLKLDRDFLVTYQSYGSHRSYLNQRTVGLLETPDEGFLSDSYIDLRNRPDGFNPTFHYHSIDEIRKLELCLFYLERIRISVMYDIQAPVGQYLSYIEILTQAMIQNAVSYFDTFITIQIKDLILSFGKAAYGVDQVPNLDKMLADDGYNYVKGNGLEMNPEKLLTMQSLIRFKDALYEVYVGGDYTQLGRAYATIVAPIFENFFRLKVGGVLMIDSYSSNINKNVQIDRLLYPNLLRTNSSFTIKKITDNKEFNSCLLLAVENQTRKVYTAKLSNTTLGYLIEWIEYKNPTGLVSDVRSIMKHLADFANPHNDKKEDLDLGNVENLPLADYYDILNDSTERKYITWFMLDRFMKRFLLKLRPSKDEQLTTVDENVMRNFSVVFSPCGQGCDTSACQVFDSVTTTQEPIIIETTTTQAPEDIIDLGIFMQASSATGIISPEQESNQEELAYDFNFDDSFSEDSQNVFINYLNDNYYEDQ